MVDPSGRQFERLLIDRLGAYLFGEASKGRVHQRHHPDLLRGEPQLGEPQGDRLDRQPVELPPRAVPVREAGGGVGIGRAPMRFGLSASVSARRQ